MNFQPKSEDELQSLLKEDTYEFEVIDAKEKPSKSSGADMIELKLAIWVGEKIRCYLFDYLMESVAFKLRHCCDACGLLDKYQSGSLDAAMFIGRTGKAKIIIQKDKNGKYPDKNTIKDYCLRPAKSIGGVQVPEQPKDEDLPF